jgi:hypothetical protein
MCVEHKKCKYCGVKNVHGQICNDCIKILEKKQKEK